MDEQLKVQNIVEIVKEAFQYYFSRLFISTIQSVEEISQVTNMIQTKINNEINLNLMRKFTKEEVKVALNQMSPLKSPELDSFGAFFTNNTKKQLVQMCVKQF